MLAYGNMFVSYKIFITKIKCIPTKKTAEKKWKYPFYKFIMHRNISENIEI